MNFVSVIIPTYKRSEKLSVAINSVLNQTYKNIEIIVVDDNGNTSFREEAYKTLASYIESDQIKYIKHKSNQGGCAARNTGAFAAKGDYIAFLDDDDFYEPTKIEEQIKFSKKNIHLDACMCSMFRIDENNEQIQSRENTARGVTLKEAILDGNLFTSMLLIKKEAFIKLGGFSEIPRFQDKYFHYKFLSAGHKIGVLNKPLLTLVEHTDIRISSIGSRKVIAALKLLAQVESKHKQLFSKKEQRFLKHRFYIKKAEVLCLGTFKDKFKSFLFCFSAIRYASKSNYLYVFKLMVKSLSPNFIFNILKEK